MKKGIISAIRALFILALLVLPFIAPFARVQWPFFIPHFALMLIAAALFFGPMDHGLFTVGREYRSFRRMHDFARAVISAPDALWLGSITGTLYASLILFAAYLVRLSRPEFNWAEKLPDATAAFLAGMSTFLVISYFYRRHAPYYDLWELLDQISEDARHAVSQEGRVQVLWVYPGFGLGYYRALDLKNPTRTPLVEEYSQFKTALREMFISDHVDLTAITYSAEQLRAFYCSYHLQNILGPFHESDRFFHNSGDRDVTPASVNWQRVLTEPAVQFAVIEESDLAKNVMGGSANALYSVNSPDDMPPNLIVIGDIVYNLSSFGFPIFHPCSTADLGAYAFKALRGFFEVNQKDKLIRLVAFRTNDRALADAVKSHVASFIALGTAHGLLKRVSGIAHTEPLRASTGVDTMMGKARTAMMPRVVVAGAFAILTVGAVVVWLARGPTVSANGHVLIEVASIVEIEPIRELRDGFEDEIARSSLGNRVDYIERNAQGESGNMNQIAAEVSRLHPRAVYVLGTPLAQAIQKQNPSVPLFQGAVTDPVAAGLANSWDGSGRPYAATSDRPPVDRILDTITRLTPGKRALGVIYNPGESNSVAVITALRGAAADKGYSIHEYGVGGIQDLPSAIASATANSEVLFVPPDNTVTSGLKGLISRAIASRVPVYATTSDAVKLGALAAVSTNFKDLGRETADIVLKVLVDGKNPATIPIQLPKSQEIIVNSRVARLLNISLSRAHSAGYIVQ